MYYFLIEKDETEKRRRKREWKKKEENLRKRNRRGVWDGLKKIKREETEGCLGGEKEPKILIKCAPPN